MEPPNRWLSNNSLFVPTNYCNLKKDLENCACAECRFQFGPGFLSFFLSINDSQFMKAIQHLLSLGRKLYTATIILYIYFLSLAPNSQNIRLRKFPRIKKAKGETHPVEFTLSSWQDSQDKVLSLFSNFARSIGAICPYFISKFNTRNIFALPG